MSPVALMVPPVFRLAPVIVPPALTVLPTVNALELLLNSRPATALAVPLSLNTTCVLEPGTATLPDTLPIKLAA